MKNCSHKLFRAVYGKRKCVREAGHTGNHSVDLSGVVLGRLLVLKPLKLFCGRKWIVEQQGKRRVVIRQRLISGKTAGRIQRGYPKNSLKMRQAVYDHYHKIFRSKGKRRESYRKMPYYDRWNPDKGGSFVVAVEWLIKHLGKRPKGRSLGVMNHDLGFVPGNLKWQTGKEQNDEKILRHSSSRAFHMEATRRGYRKVK